jgi:hypothetical protein
MKNGTSTAVLVEELIRCDGPFATIADDFVTQQCGFCGREVDDDAQFTPDGFWCSACADAIAASAR